MWKNTVDYLIYDFLGLSGHLGDAINFFIYDTVKIFALLVSIIYLVTILRSYFPVEKARAFYKW